MFDPLAIIGFLVGVTYALGRPPPPRGMLVACITWGVIGAIGAVLFIPALVGLLTIDPNATPGDHFG